MEQLTIHTLIERICQQLTPAYKELSLAKRHAWWMAETVLQKNQAALIAQEDITLSSEQKEKLTDWVGRIIEHSEPIHYIIGEIPFGTLTLHTEHPILIPRPETEEWVHEFIKRCKLQGVDQRPFSVLDVGTGSGCIAIAIAHHFPLATVIAVDNNPDALTLAKKNAKKYALENVHFVQSDLFEAVPEDVQFDIILSNPPYVSMDQFFTLDCSVTAWEDCNALVSEDDGFAHLETIARHAVEKRLKTHSKDEQKLFPERLLLEIGHTQAERIVAYLTTLGCTQIEVKKDLAGHDRLVSATL